LFDVENIRLREDADGGALMDVGCYCVSASRLVGGEPERVYSEAWWGPTGTDWVLTGSMRFPDGVLATFDCGTALPSRDELEIIGTEGSIFLDDPWHCRSPAIEVRGRDGVSEVNVDPANSYRLEVENVSDAIRGVGALLLGRDDAVAQARTLESLYRSARSGTAIAIS
jgi:predicted dehydrogenase